MSQERFLKYVDEPQVLTDPDGTSELVPGLIVANKAVCANWVGQAKMFWMTSLGRPTSPSRAAWELFRTRGIGKRRVYNQCGNKRCVNPAHHSYAPPTRRPHKYGDTYASKDSPSD